MRLGLITTRLTIARQKSDQRHILRGPDGLTLAQSEPVPWSPPSLIPRLGHDTVRIHSSRRIWRWSDGGG